MTAAVIIEGGRLLMVRRGPKESLPGMWELPGGKIEPGETPSDCLSRELLEELSMQVEVGAELARTTYHYDHGSFEMLALAVTRLSGFRLSVHDRYAWLESGRLPQYQLAPADVELVAQLVEAGHWA